MSVEEQTLVAGQNLLTLLVAVGVTVISAGVVGFFTFIFKTKADLVKLESADTERAKCITRIEKKIDINTEMQSKLADGLSEVGKATATQGAIMAGHLKDADQAMERFFELEKSVADMRTNMTVLQTQYQLTNNPDVDTVKDNNAKKSR